MDVRDAELALVQFRLDVLDRLETSTQDEQATFFVASDHHGIVSLICVAPRVCEVLALWSMDLLRGSDPGRIHCNQM